MKLFHTYLLIMFFGFFTLSGQEKTQEAFIDSTDFYVDKLIIGINLGFELEDARFFINEKNLKKRLLKGVNGYVEKLKGDVEKYIFYTALAYNYYDAANYQETQPLLIKALDLSERLKNKSFQCVVYNMIGNVFAESNMYENSIKNFYRAISLAKRIQDKTFLCTVYGNIASCFYRFGEINKSYLDSAVMYNNICIELAEKFNKNDDLHLAYQCLGLVETDRGNFKEAERAFRKALQICGKIGNVPLLYYGQYQLGRMFVEKGEADSALKYLKLASVSAVEYNDNSLLNETLYEFARIYEIKGEYKKSSYYALRFAEFNDSLIKLENARTTAELSEKYESVKKEAQISELNLSQKEKQAQIDRQLYMIIGSVVILIFVGFAAFSLYRSNKIRKKANKELSEKNTLIEAQKKEVEEQKELVDEKNKEILDSIRYAKRIQQSLLPTDKYLERNLKQLKKDKKTE